MVVPLVDDLENTFFIRLPHNFVKVSSLQRVGHDHLIKQQLAKDVLVQAILLEFKVKILNGVTLDDG